MTPCGARRSAGCASKMATRMMTRTVVVVTAVVVLACVGSAAAQDDADVSLWQSLLASWAPSATRTEPSADQPLKDAVLQDQPQDQEPVTESVSDGGDQDDSLWESLTAGREDNLAIPDPASSPPTLDWHTAPVTEVPTSSPPSPSSSPSTPPSPFSPSGPGGWVYDVQVQTSPPEDPRPDAVSLAFVFDSTGSMYRDLEQLKRGAAAILAAMLARPDKPISDYVFVPFNDPGE